MKRNNRHHGFTLPEQIIVIAGVVLLAAIAMPAVKAFLKTFESTDAARTMISSVLTSARALAVKHQRYAGIRFQIAGYHGPNLSGENRDKLMEGSQYIIFIMHDPDKTGLPRGFRAVEGVAPIKLPDSVGVMDLKHLNPNDEVTKEDPVPDYFIIENNDQINKAWVLRDTTSFSIIFSPQGKLVVHDVGVRNREGVRDTISSGGQSRFRSLDDVFNTRSRVGGFDFTYGIQAGKFVQDDYLDFGLWQEFSRRSFIIYEKEQLSAAYNRNAPYSDYLSDLEEIFINPYTGTMIQTQSRDN